MERLRTVNARLEIEVHGLRVDKEMVELKAREAEVDLADAQRELTRLEESERAVAALEEDKARLEAYVHIHTFRGRACGVFFGAPHAAYTRTPPVAM